MRSESRFRLKAPFPRNLYLPPIVTPLCLAWQNERSRVRGLPTGSPWQLKVALSDAAPATRQAGSAPSFASIRTLASYPTSNIAILPPPGDSRRFDVAFGFSGTAIVAALFANGRAGDPRAALAGEESLTTEAAAVPKQANMVVRAQYSFINDLLKLYAPNMKCRSRFRA